MSNPIRYDLTLDQGATFQYIFYLVDASNNPRDMTGYTAFSQMKKSYSSATAKAFTVTVNALAGSISLAMAPALTYTITSGRYVYDVVMIDAANTATRVIEGQVYVTPGVSNVSIETTPNTYNANTDYVVVPLTQ